LALANGTLSEDRYLVLKHRVPFEGYVELKRADLAYEIGITREMIRQNELSGYDILAGYLHRYLSQDKIPDIDIRYLPWAKYHEFLKSPRRAPFALMKEIANGNPVTVRQVVQYFKDLEESGRPVQIIKYGPKSYKVTKAVFKEINIELPNLIAE